MAEHVYRPQHSQLVPNTGALPATPATTPVPSASGSGVPPVGIESKIRSLSSAKVETVESRWKRPLNKNGAGATHVRTFVGSLSQQGLEYLDRHINEWLDTHPDAEVKFATLQVGDMPTATGREPALIAQVWI